ncbi:Proteasome activator complex subunit 4, partial [Fragariocoptes setiger]
PQAMEVDNIMNKTLDLLEKYGALDTQFDIEEDDEEDAGGSLTLQSENVYNRLLPYDTSVECQTHLARIKAYLAKTIQLDQETCLEWLIELERFTSIYGLAFCKSDHLNFIHLLYRILVSPNQDLSFVSFVARLLTLLLKKRSLITREELVIEWRPLYELYEKLLFSNTEALGMRYIPDNLENSIKNLICVARAYFSVDSTQEMLDEWRPLLCPYDSTIRKATNYMCLFLPTVLPLEHHDKGFKLWFDEVMQMWLNCRMVSVYEQRFSMLLARLSYDCLGYIDWEPYIPRIFTHIKAGFNLNGGHARPSVRRYGDSLDIPPRALWIVSMLGDGGGCQQHITKLFKAIESYYHPSNYERRHSILHQFLYKLPACFVRRIYRERYKKTQWTPVPDSHKLSDDDITEFIESIKPVLFTSMFNQSGLGCAASAFRDLAVLRPEKIIPPLLERLYGSYETLNEPLRFLASINCTASVAHALVKPSKHFPEGPSHVVPLLLSSLPGIDSNDMRKCLAVLRFISTLSSFIQMEDYSWLADERPDLTPEQQELCFASSKFEEFVIQFLDKCFVLIENSASANFSNLDQENEIRNRDEGIIEAAISSVTLAILAQASQKIQEAAVNKIYSHTSRHIFDTKTQGKAIASLCLALVKANPELSVPKFLPHASKLILTLTENPEVFEESILDDELLFSMLLMSEIVRCHSDTLVKYKDLIIAVLHRALKLNAKEGYQLGCSMLRHLLRALTNISCFDWKSIVSPSEWPFDQWGSTIHVDDLKIKWHVPGPEAQAFASELCNTFMVQAINDLLRNKRGEIQLSRDKVQRSLHVILSTLVGAAAVLPPWESAVIDLCPVEVPVIPMYIQDVGINSITFSDGTNIRTQVANHMREILDHLLDALQDDTKSLSLVCEIFSVLMTYFGTSKAEYRMASQRVSSMRRGMDNKLLGSKRHIRLILVERVVLQHRNMMYNRGSPFFTELHQRVFEDMFKLSISHYSDVRIIAQESIHQLLQVYPHFETVLVPRLSASLKEPEIEHNRFKGLLYIIYGKRSCSSLMTDPNWSDLKSLWPAIIQSNHSEKPSIVRLLDRLCAIAQKSFNTFELEFGFDDHVKALAVELSKSTDTSVCAPVTQEDIILCKTKSAERNRARLEDYHQLVTKLVELIECPQLHWHRRILAYTLLSLLVRDDIQTPLPAVKLFVSALISERISIRKKAIELVTSQLKLLKRKHVKRDIEPTNDNKWMQYRLTTEPYTEEEWSKLVFIDRPETGYYCWPKPFRAYAPYSEQPLVDRTYDEYNDYERAIYDNFHNPEFVVKLCDYYILEEDKKTDRFNCKRFMMFKGLFRNFGPCMIEPFRKYIDEFARSDCEQKQRFVAEYLAGLIRGSKHWSYSMLMELRDYVMPLLVDAPLTQENISDWTTFVNYVFKNRDIKRFEWLLYYLVKRAVFDAQTETNITPFVQSARLALANMAIGQCEWRAINQIFPAVLEGLKNQDKLLAYANVRNQLVSVYSMIFSFDYPEARTLIPGTLEGGPKRKDFIEFLLPKVAILEKSNQDKPMDVEEGSPSDGMVIDQELTASTSQATPCAATPLAGLPVVSVIEKAKLALEQLRLQSTSTPGNDAQVTQALQRDLELLESLAGKTSEDYSQPDVAAKLQQLSIEFPTSTAMANVGSEIVPDASQESEERKEAKKLMKLACTYVIYDVCRMLSSVPPELFKLLPVICDMGRETNDPELVAESAIATAVLGSLTLSLSAVDEAINAIRKIVSCHSWHARSAAATFLQIMVSSNLFLLLDNPRWIADISDLIINSMMFDRRIEVRESSASTLSGLIHCEFVKVTQEFINEFRRRANSPIVRRKQSNGSSTLEPQSIVIRHSGVLGLCACVDAYPYTVPDYLPDILTVLSDHLSDPQPISTTIKKTMGNFKRTHYDNWQSDKAKFSEDQLGILADILVSPTYYA